ncbi:MAG: UDP-2,3-diacylglucosamine diphosphatase LpxI [Rhizobiales bacterium]|nr:UDP-2,3-diacylglucosamine diphosphatase LpxI [Hyphomicrobiales bacterium]
MTTSSAAGEPLTIVAGGGSVPAYVAAAAMKAGRPVLIIALKGEADPSVEAFPHEWVGWGDLGRLEALLKRPGARDMVLIGSVRSRPDFNSIKIDLATMRSLKDILSIIVGGDDDVLSGTIKFFERRGQRIVGAHEIATDLVAAPGPLGRRKPGRGEAADIAVAMRAARAIGAIDAGQAAVVVNGRVVALEAAEGTDQMLERVKGIRASGRVKWSGRAGVLAKCPRPQQDLRVDMPTIGPRTIEAVIEAGLAGIAVAAGKVMIVDREAVVRRADEAGLFLVGEADPAS